MRTLDVAVAGCGPCGLAAALLLARSGHRVTLFERFEEPRPLGSGLLIQPTGAAVLDRLGLGCALRDHGTPVDHLLGITTGGRTVLDVSYAALGKDAPAAIGIHRAGLFSVLFDAVGREAIAIETGQEIVGSEPVAAGRRLRFSGERVSARFDLVVDALGTRTPLAPPAGHMLDFGALWATLDRPPESPFSARVLEQRYRAARQMVGVLPIGRSISAKDQLAFFWSIRGDAIGRWRESGLAAWKDEVIALWPATVSLLDQIESFDQLSFARYAHRTLRQPAEAQLIHLGDAWHSASPQLGQGANMALLDAYALAEAVAAARDVPDALVRVVELRRRHVRLYQRLTALLTPVYQSESTWIPWMRDRLLAPMSRVAIIYRFQAMLVAGLVGAPLLPLGLAQTASSLASEQ